jgi:hypothetical protein
MAAVVRAKSQSLEAFRRAIQQALACARVGRVSRIAYVSGRLGAGKSSLAAPLAAELGYSLVTKDLIKETLHDALYVPGDGDGEGEVEVEVEVVVEVEVLARRRSVTDACVATLAPPLRGVTRLARQGVASARVGLLRGGAIGLVLSRAKGPNQCRLSVTQCLITNSSPMRSLWSSLSR